MTSLKQQIEKLPTVSQQHEVEEWLSSIEYVKRSSVLRLVAEHEKILKEHLTIFPETALIGWAPNPETAKAFDSWFEKLKELIEESK